MAGNPIGVGGNSDSTWVARGANAQIDFTFAEPFVNGDEPLPVYVGVVTTATTAIGNFVGDARSSNFRIDNLLPQLIGLSTNGVDEPSDFTVGGTVTALTALAATPWNHFYFWAT